MCMFKSMILLKDRVFCPDYDSHNDMLEELGIVDNKEIPDFVKVEIVPHHYFSDPLEKWKYETDQDNFPEWYVKEFDEMRCREELKKWASKHIFRDGTHKVHSGTYYACGNANVEICEKAEVYATGNAGIEASEFSHVYATGNSKVSAFNHSVVQADENSVVIAWDSCFVDAFGNSKVSAYDASIVKAHNTSKVKGHCISLITLYDNSKIVELNDRAVCVNRKSNLREHDVLTADDFKET